jgi:hypothetical protein
MIPGRILPNNGYFRVSKTWLFIWTALIVPACSCGLSAQTGQFSAHARQGPLRVQLYDASGLPLSKAVVEVTSDNGIRCEMSPCPTSGQTWSGQSDNSGALIIPRSAIQTETYVRTKDYRSVRLPEPMKYTSRVHQIELHPEWLYGQQYDWTRGYKLVDARSGKVLARAPVRIEFPPDDWPAQHGGIGSLEVKTNPRGYIFFSFLRKPEEIQEQTLPAVPQADWVTPVAWVAVSGYRRAKLNYFEGSDAERFTTRLQPQ